MPSSFLSITCGQQLPSCLLLVLLVLAQPGHAELTAEVSEFTLDIPVEMAAEPEFQWLHSDGNNVDPDRGPLQLYVVASDGDDPRNRVLAGTRFEAQGWITAKPAPLDPGVRLLQSLHVAQGIDLYTYNNGRVDKLAGSSAVAHDFPAIYRTEALEFDAAIEFAQDLNDDGLDDLLMPDFRGWRFARGLQAGGFAPTQLFGPEPVMNAGSARYVNFTAHQPYLFDHNADGRTDLGFWEDDALAVYYQNEGAQFATEPVRFEVGSDIESDAFFSLSVGTDEDNPTGRQALLDTIEDLNADGVPDMLVYSVTGEGLFGKETRYEVHLGRVNAKGVLEFEPEPSSVVGSGGIQLDVERQDLDGDGSMEMLITSFDLGIGSIIRALISRSANLQLAIYKMQNGRYPSTPNLTRKVTARLDIANGDIFIPAVLAGDVDGDGLKDLLVQNGDDELRVYPGTGKQRLFARSAQTLELELPEGQGELTVLDVDRNGTDDLLLLFGGTEEAPQRARVHAVRFARTAED